MEVLVKMGFRPGLLRFHINSVDLENGKVGPGDDSTVKRQTSAEARLRVLGLVRVWGTLAKRFDPLKGSWIIGKIQRQGL